MVFEKSYIFFTRKEYLKCQINQQNATWQCNGRPCANRIITKQLPYLDRTFSENDVVDKINPDVP